MRACLQTHPPDCGVALSCHRMVTGKLTQQNKAGSSLAGHRLSANKRVGTMNQSDQELLFLMLRVTTCTHCIMQMPNIGTRERIACLALSRIAVAAADWVEVISDILQRASNI